MFSVSPVWNRNLRNLVTDSGSKWNLMVFFVVLGFFFFLRERVVDNFLCSVVDWRMVENFSVDDACPSESTAYHQSFLLFCLLLCFWVQQVGGKEEGHSIFLDQHHHHHFSSPSNCLLMFLQSPDSRMHGGLYPSLDVALSNLSPPLLGSSHEFLDGGANKQPSSLGQTLLFRSLCYCFMYASLSMVQVLWLCNVCEAYFAKDPNKIGYCDSNLFCMYRLFETPWGCSKHNSSYKHEEMM